MSHEKGIFFYRIKHITYINIARIVPIKTYDLEAEQVVWVSVVKSFKGHYIMKNATANPDLFSVFPITGYIWKIKLKFIEGKEYVAACAEAEVKQVQI